MMTVEGMNNMNQLKQTILNSLVEDMKLCHDALKKENYFEYKQEEVKEKILISLFIDARKQWYFSGLEKKAQ